jgi:Zn-dependent peptidase ImmA (M78 family)/transcriptional regulator with XRE-family HTH domain
MARNNALITPQILIWARERLGLSLPEAARYIKKKPDTLKAWEEGKEYPTVRQAKEIAKKYKIPYVFFFLPEPPQNIKLPKNQDYRTLSNQPLRQQSIELKTLLFDIMQRREVMLELYNQMGIEFKDFTYYFDITKTDDSQIVDTIKTLLQLPETIKKTNAFNIFRGALENIGILVFQAADVPTHEMRGLSVLEKVFPIIVVNRKDAPSARIFTLMHELVHLITRTAGICDTTGFSELTSFEIELKCNHIAAQVLVPENMLKTNAAYMQLMQNWNDNLVRQIADSFFVSREVIIGRLLAIKSISFDFYRKKNRQYMDEYFKSNSNKESGILPPSTDKESQLGKTYIGTVLTAFSQDIITARDAISYFEGLRLKHFEKLERWCFA